MDYGDSVHEQILVCSAFSVLDISIDYQLRYISKDSQFCCRHSLSKISSGLTVPSSYFALHLELIQKYFYRNYFCGLVSGLSTVV